MKDELDFPFPMPSGQRAKVLHSALHALEKGMSVLPCLKDKRPARNLSYYEASSDPVVVSAWFRDPDEEFQLGLPCRINNLVVLDVDDHAALAEFLQETGHEVPETFTVRTPSGGLHFYFWADLQHDYPGELRAGVDIKFNGYVLAPPSMAFSRRIGTEGYYKVARGGEIAQAPHWLSRPAVGTPKLPVTATRLADGAGNTDTEEVLALLDSIHPDVDYNTWLNVLMAVHEVFAGSAEAFAIADEWSSKGAKYEPGDVAKRWHSFNVGGGVGMSTLAGIAKAHGADVSAIAMARRKRQLSGAKAAIAEPFDLSKLDLSSITLRDDWADPALHDAPSAGAEPVPEKGSTYVGKPTQQPDRFDWISHNEEDRKALIGRAKQLRASVFSAESARLNTACSYLIKGVLDRESIALMYGPSGVGKTFLGLHLANAVATGSAFAGHRTRPGSVLYISAEGTSAVERRVMAMSPKAGERLCILPKPVDLHSSDLDVRALAAIIKDMEEEYGAFDLVVIDTLARSFGSGDENSSAEMNTVINRVSALKDLLGATVLLVHHTGKDEDRGARGSSALKAAIETELKLSKSGDDVLVKATKQRDMAQGEVCKFKLLPVELGQDDEGDPITSCRIEFVDKSAVSSKASGKNQKIVLAQLETLAASTHCSEGWVAREDVIKAAEEATQSGEKAVSRRGDSEALTALVKKGVLQEESDKVRSAQHGV